MNKTWVLPATGPCADANGDPVDYADPLGLFGLPSLPPWLYYSSVGIADVLSMDIGPLLREEYGIGGADTCSSSYEVGESAGIIGGVLTGEGELNIAFKTADYAPRLIEAGVVQAPHAKEAVTVLEETATFQSLEQLGVTSAEVT